MQRFHDEYNRTGIALRPDPVIVLENDYLVLLRGNQREAKLVNPDVYHALKVRKEPLPQHDGR